MILRDTLTQVFNQNLYSDAYQYQASDDFDLSFKKVPDTAKASIANPSAIKTIAIISILFCLLSNHEYNLRVVTEAVFFYILFKSSPDFFER